MAQPEASFKVCGLCSQLVDESVRLEDAQLEFLVALLGFGVTDLPAKVCAECHRGTLDCKRFKEKCVRTVGKLKKTHISTGMILGRSSEDIRALRQKNIHSPAPANNNVRRTPAAAAGLSRTAAARGRQAAAAREVLLEEDEDVPLSRRRVKRPMKAAAAGRRQGGGKLLQPEVILTSRDRAQADGYLMKRSKSGRVIKPPKDFSGLKSKRGGARAALAAGGVKRKGRVIAECTIDDDPVPPPPPVIDVEDRDEEIFPSVGPYQCEICQNITDTKKEFVAHIKANHKDMIDDAVLRSLESDLKKRKKKELEKAGKAGGKKKAALAKAKAKPKPKPKPKRKRKKPRKSNQDKSSGDEDDDDDADYKPGRSSKKLKNSQEASLEGSPKMRDHRNQETAAASNATGSDAKKDGGESEKEGESVKSTFDTKFKANIAKRYEAETGIVENGETAAEESEQSAAGEAKETPSSEEPESVVPQQHQEQEQDQQQEQQQDQQQEQEHEQQQPVLMDDSASQAVDEEVATTTEQQFVEEQAVIGAVQPPSSHQASTLAMREKEPLDSFETLKKPLGLRPEDSMPQNSPASYGVGEPPELVPVRRELVHAAKDNGHVEERLQQEWREQQQQATSTLDLAAISPGNSADSIERQMAALHNVAPWQQYGSSFFDH